MTPLLFDWHDAGLTGPLREALGAGEGRWKMRRFPDGESHVRVDSDVQGQHTLIVADLSQPDARFLPLSFLAITLTELGAASVGLVAPYLCYMRQDKRFQPGEAISSRIFAGLLSKQISWLVTVDPHLHRYSELGEIYSVPAVITHAAPLLADWIARSEDDYLLVGPDSESEQWVAEIARRSGCPYVVGSKNRRGDRDVEVSLPDLRAHRGATPLIADDIISSGHTILQCIDALQAQGFETIDCAAVHGLFADDCDRQLKARLRRLVSTNAIPTRYSDIDLTDVLVPAIRECFTGLRAGS